MLREYTISEQVEFFNDDFFIERLKRETTQAIGFLLLTKSDCGRLSDFMVKNGYGYISESTLYRMFFQFGKHKPYKHTLELLCRFLGYKNLHHFIEEQSLLRDKLCANGVSHSIESSLLYNCIETSSYKALDAYFERISE